MKPVDEKKEETPEQVDKRKDRWRKYKVDKVRTRGWMAREDYETVKQKATHCGKSFWDYMVSCALGKKTISKTDMICINALASLGGLQNKLTSDLRETYGKNDEKIELLITEMRGIYRQIHLAIMAVKKVNSEDVE